MAAPTGTHRTAAQHPAALRLASEHRSAAALRGGHRGEPLAGPARSAQCGRRAARVPVADARAPAANATRATAACAHARGDRRALRRLRARQQRVLLRPAAGRLRRGARPLPYRPAAPLGGALRAELRGRAALLAGGRALSRAVLHAPLHAEEGGSARGDSQGDRTDAHEATGGPLRTRPRGRSSPPTLASLRGPQFLAAREGEFPISKPVLNLLIHLIDTL